MRKLCLAAAFGAHVSAAMAADLGPLNASPPPVFTWTGAYLGANIGGAWSSIQDHGLGGSSASSVIGGVSAGYNWQFATLWVIGIEGDASWADLTVPAGAGDVNWIASVRGRVGWTPTTSTMLYFTGGAVRGTVSIPGVDTLPATQAKTGWVVGGGVEWAPWSSNWLVGAEYLNYNFTGFLLGAGLASDITINEMRAGAAYKF
jgi:outer membrane immunogenic protein